MQAKAFPTINLVKTGENIRRLRESRGLTVRDVQAYFGFEAPQAIYKWERGKSIPTVDNLLALAYLFDVRIDDIIICRAYFHSMSASCRKNPAAVLFIWALQQGSTFLRHLPSILFPAAVVGFLRQEVTQ